MSSASFSSAFVGTGENFLINAVRRGRNATVNRFHMLQGESLRRGQPLGVHLCLLVQPRAGKEFTYITFLTLRKTLGFLCLMVRKSGFLAPSWT